jgi:hypothetical protein
MVAMLYIRSLRLDRVTRDSENGSHQTAWARPLYEWTMRSEPQVTSLRGAFTPN